MEDRILETHVIKWMKSVEVIDANKDRLEDKELQAYTTIRNIFGKNRPNMELLTTSCEVLEGYLDGGVKDKVFTAVRDFLKTSAIAKENFQAFKEILEDRDFFETPAQTIVDTSSNGVSVGTATYRRVEADGNVYEGMFLGNERVWKGKITYADGSFYEGEWNNGGPHGEGVLIWQNGTKFTGRFSGLSGNGKIEYAGGNSYEGAWNENGPHGYGVYKMDGRIERGQYADGLRVGKGRMEWNNGDWYEGEWNEQGANGYGVFRIGNRTDKGRYENGKRVGSGRMEWDDGDWYEGEWNEKGANGEGVMRVGNRIDRGHYSNHCRVDTGRMEWDDGSWYEGGWNDNGKHGKGTHYLATYKRTDIGDWKDGHETGSVVMKWNNGDIYSGTWSRNSNGDLNGVGEYYTASTNNTRKGKWVNGNWINDWCTTRNVIGTLMIAGGVISLFTGNWLQGIIVGILGFWVYEGK